MRWMLAIDLNCKREEKRPSFYSCSRISRFLNRSAKGSITSIFAGGSIIFAKGTIIFAETFAYYIVMLTRLTKQFSWFWNPTVNTERLRKGEKLRMIRIVNGKRRSDRWNEISTVALRLFTYTNNRLEPPIYSMDSLSRFLFVSIAHEYLLLRLNTSTGYGDSPSGCCCDDRNVAVFPPMGHPWRCVVWIILIKWRVLKSYFVLKEVRIVLTSDTARKLTCITKT